MIKKLLVIRLGALGDLLHVSPSLAAVKAAYPDMEVHVLSSPAYRDLLAMMPGVDQVWTWDKRQGWRGWWRLLGQLRQAGMDGVINLHPSFKTWLLAQALQPQHQAVYRKEKLRAKGQAQRSLERRHAVRDFYEPFRHLLHLPEPDGLIPALALSGKAPTSSVSEKPVGERWVGIIPGVGGKRGNRAWTPEAYQALMAALLAESRMRILLIGGPDEAALAGQLTEALPGGRERVENHCGRHDIPGTARLLAQCDVVIGGDTGPMHLAAAVGVPLVVIYGPTSPDRTGPVGGQPIHVLTPPDDLACWPCELPRCPLTGDQHLACMRQITMESALNACRQVLKNSSKPV